MFRIIKPEKKFVGDNTFTNAYAEKMRRNYLSQITKDFSLTITFKIAGYGLEISNSSIMYATMIMAYWFLIIWGNTIGFNSVNQFVILAESLAGGFLSMIAISLILGILNVIYNIPKYIMINR